MKNDFNWLRKVIFNKGNMPKHYDAIIKLSLLFKIKWEHNVNNPKYRNTYLIYTSYLRLCIKRMYN